MKKTKVNADEVRRLKAALRKINRLQFKDIEWVNDKGKTLEFAEEVIHNWDYTGLNNCDFVEVVIDGSKSVTIMLGRKRDERS